MHSTFLLHELHVTTTLPFLLDVFTKVQEVTISFVMPVCPSVSPHRTIWLPLDAFSQNLIFEVFFKMSRKFKPD
jgi:hypothetical protein